MLESTLAILNANVYTLNPGKPSAKAIAVYDNRIVAVGTTEQVRRFIGRGTKVIDANKGTIIPGLNDCHVHMFSFGQFLQTLELRNTRSIKELQTKLRRYAERNPEKDWIQGGRWDEEKLAEKRYPTRYELDAAVSDRPVFLVRVCGHVAVANSRALQAAGITRKTAIQGGRAELDPQTGELNGVLYENALNLVSKTVPKPSSDELEHTCLLACKRAIKAGLTCVHWIIGSSREIDAIQKVQLAGKMPLRIHLGIPISLLEPLTLLGLQTGFGNDMVKIGFVKILADGSLGGHTAALEKPYSDKPETCGMMMYDEKQLFQLFTKSDRAGLQIAVHAIGDRAIEAVLNSFEKTLKTDPSNAHRHRIEHCSVLNPEMIRRMKKLRLIASVQPHFVPSDFWLIDRVGQTRARWVYPFKTLMRQGLTLAAGSDCPVEPISPILGVWGAVTRKRFTEENLTVQEALRMYTVNAAYSSFDEKERGTIEVGKLADLTILSADLLNVPLDDIKKIKVHMTIVDGKVVYARRRSSRSH
jgi:hypothetical protein